MSLLLLLKQAANAEANIIVLFPSTNISANAAGATTAQLTAPSGKNASNWQAGNISDDTNPLPGIDLAANAYTEVEFSIQITANANLGEVYQLRLTANGTPLEQYAANAQITIGLANIIIPQAMMHYKMRRSV